MKNACEIRLVTRGLQDHGAVIVPLAYKNVEKVEREVALLGNGLRTRTGWPW